MQEQISRRGILGMFAAGVGAAILPSGVIMPVRNLLTWDDFITTQSAFDIARQETITVYSIWVGRDRLHCAHVSGSAQDAKMVREYLINCAQLTGSLSDCHMNPRRLTSHPSAIIH